MIKILCQKQRKILKFFGQNLVALVIRLEIRREEINSVARNVQNLMQYFSILTLFNVFKQQFSDFAANQTLVSVQAGSILVIIS